MASFTDNPQALGTFNPYVQQLPVEAMVKVGMYKQEQYNQGIQKIQTAIDNIAGLDIAKDADKAYLQSKVNELGNNLKFVAAGDFSDFQLVNSVNGMTNQLVKDSNVQNAVASTAKLRKEQQRKEKAIQDGKSSPDNEWYFNNQVSSYLDDSTIGQSFNGQYIEYTDVDKKLRDLHSKLKEADVSIDNPYIRDNSGKTLYYYRDAKGNEIATTDPAKGEPKYDYTMLTTKVKGIGAEKILNNFYDSLNENDKRQLNITAQYHYKDKNSYSIQQDIIKTYDEKKQIYSDAIIDASVRLAKGDLTPNQEESLKSQIAKARELVYEGGFDKEMNEELLAVDTEEEATSYKYKTYTQKYLTNLAKDLDNETKSIEFKNNPGRQAVLEQKKFEFDIAKERQREKEWNAKFQLDLNKDRREEEESERKRKEDVKLRPIVGTEKIKTDITKYGIFDLEKDMDLAKDDLTKTTNQLASLISPNAKTPKEKQDALKAANILYNDYLENPYVVTDNAQRQLLEKMDTLDNVQYKLSTKYAAAKKAGAVIGAQADKVINQQNSLKIDNTLFSAKDLYDFNNQTGKFIKRSEGRVTAMGPSTGVSYMTEDILQQYKGTKNYPIALAIYKKYNNKPLTAGEEKIVNHIEKINSNVSKSVRQIKQKQREVESKTIYDLSPEYQQMKIQINPENKRDINTIDQIIGLKTKDYIDYGALDSENPNDFSPAKLAEMQKAGNLGFTYLKNYDGSATLVLTSGENVQKIPLTKEEFRNWATDYSYINPMTDVISAVQSSPNKTTNKANVKEASTARYRGYSPLLPGFNNTKLAPKIRLDIEGSPENTGKAETDMFQARLYYHNGKNWQHEVLNQGGYLDASNLQILLSQTGQKTIETLFK